MNVQQNVAITVEPAFNVMREKAQRRKNRQNKFEAELDRMKGLKKKTPYKREKFLI